MKVTSLGPVRYGPPTDDAPLHLPTPRLQFRWEATGDADFQWGCHYELVFALRPLDIRLEQTDDTPPVTVPGVAVVPLGYSRTGCTGKPWDTPHVRHRRPYRNGAHASWDSEALGGLPVYVLAPGMDPARVPEREDAA